jgi:hypothetical protein
VALVRIDSSQEVTTSIIRVTRISELGTTLFFLRSVLRLQVATKIFPNLRILLILGMEAIRSFETSVLTIATRRNILEYDILHNHPRENLIEI